MNEVRDVMVMERAMKKTVYKGNLERIGTGGRHRK